MLRAGQLPLLLVPRLGECRDEGFEERLQVVGDTFGVWKCRTAFNCTNACPREIEVTRAIAEVKKALTSGEI